MFQVLNNSEKSEAISAEAERLEDLVEKVSSSLRGQGTAAHHTKLHVPTCIDVVPSESTGVVMVSASPQTLGQVTFASQAACQMLGYTRLQLERRNVNLIVPSPIAEVQ